MASPKDLIPTSPYFLIKIGKAEQKKKEEYLSEHILADPFSVYMKRKLQWGEIVAIGDGAKEYFPQASIGDLLMVHHMIQGKKTEKGYSFFLVEEDDDFDYYVVNAYEMPGEKNLSYACAKGREIIPNSDYIFLEVEPAVDNEMEVSAGGLLVPKERKKSRDEWSAIMKQNMARCQQLARNVPQDPMEEKMWLRDSKKRELMEYSLKEIKKLEAENIAISKDINKKKYELFKVAFVNPDWNEWHKESFGEYVNPGDMVYMLNIACHTHFEIFGKNYIVCENKYYGFSLNFVKKSIEKYHAATSCDNNEGKTKTGRRRNKSVGN